MLGVGSKPGAVSGHVFRLEETLEAGLGELDELEDDELEEKEILKGLKNTHGQTVGVFD